MNIICFADKIIKLIKKNKLQEPIANSPKNISVELIDQTIEAAWRGLEAEPAWSIKQFFRQMLTYEDNDLLDLFKIR